jgi:hypothetical protein
MRIKVDYQLPLIWNCKVDGTDPIFGQLFGGNSSGTASDGSKTDLFPLHFVELKDVVEHLYCMCLVIVKEGCKNSGSGLGGSLGNGLAGLEALSGGSGTGTRGDDAGSAYGASHSASGGGGRSSAGGAGDFQIMPIGGGPGGGMSMPGGGVGAGVGGVFYDTKYYAWRVLLEQAWVEYSICRQNKRGLIPKWQMANAL